VEPRGYQEHPALVSIVILNWNGLPDIVRCASCVSQQDYSRIEVIVVDNGSRDGSLEALRAEFPQFVTIENGSNLGFARGMNIGIAASKGEYILPLNQDAFLDPRFVSSAAEAMSRDSTIGAASGTVLACEQFELEDDSCPNLGDAEAGYLLRRHIRGVAARPTQDAQGAQYVFGPSGCCPFFRRSMLEDIKLSADEYFDESYVTGGEDIDLYFRMQLRGWRCRHVSTAIAWHVGSGSVGGKRKLVEKPLWYQRNWLRNRYLTIIGDIPLGAIFRLAPYILLAEALFWPYYLLKSPRTLIALVWAWWDMIRMLPATLHKRRRVQSTRRIQMPDLMDFFIKP